MSQNETSKRKSDHIDLALKSQVELGDSRFNYEPVLAAHPKSTELHEIPFLGKRMKAPLWVSSMTGGSAEAGKINKTLARACSKFGLGMGLGSCRIILDDDTHLSDFQMRKLIGDDQPFYANLGIAQLEELISSNKSSKIKELVDKLEADGLIIHVNPLQEWLQPEGDLIEKSAIATIDAVLQMAEFPIIVKEVGQGFGPKSLAALIDMEVPCIDFGAFGGTNFAMLELLRGDEVSMQAFKGLASIGHSAEQMVELCNEILGARSNQQFIISGGVKDFLDGYYLMSKLQSKSIYAHASTFLTYANKGDEALYTFISNQIKGLALADQFLTIRE